MRVVLIGVSHWHAALHAKGFAGAGAEIVAVSDPDLAAAGALAKGLGVKAFGDHRQMLETEQPDLAVVMGTPLQMPQYARDLIEANLPFVSEKPLGLNAEVIEPILAQASQKKLFVAVAFANRYSGVWDELEKASRASHMHFRIINGSPERYVRDGVGWVLQPQMAGGGVLRNLGIHGVDAFCAMAQEEDVEVLGCALSSRMHRLGAEDFASLTLCTPSGLVGTIEAGYTFATLQAGGDYEFRVATKEAYILEQGDALKMSAEGQTTLRPTVPTGLRYDALAKDVLGRFKERQPPRAGLGDLYKAMKVIDQAYAKATWV